MQPTTLISDITRLTDKQTRALKRLRIETVLDLLYYFPTRYSNLSEIKSIEHISAGDTATVYGKILNPKTKKSFRGKVPMAEAQLEDLSGKKLKVIWFHQAFIAKQLEHGQPIKLTGKISENSYGKAMTNPEFELLPDLPIDHHDSLFADDQSAQQVFGYPVYRESRGITSKWMYHTIRKILADPMVTELIDPIPDEILEKYHLPGLQTALVWIHSPQKSSDAEAARKRFAFQEVFLIQLTNYRSRYQYEQHHAYTLSIDKQGLQKFIDRFPFTPTGAQSRCLDAIVSDLASGRPMSRLLEGDVGSGKTFVAASASYAVVTNRPTGQDFGYLQVAYMAPTEVLANQLFEGFISYFKGTGMSIVLLTGQTCKKYPSKVDPSGWTTMSRAQALKWIANGEIPIVVGTHTLIQKKVKFKDLGLVIVDEQHRFGTKQRMKLAKKDGHVPHYLSMSATPIPRTLALTIYGDLDLSVIDEMPVGRKSVITEITAPDKREAAYEHIHTQLKAGRQLYVICPRIDEPDPSQQTALRVKSVTAETKRLKKNVFIDYRIESLHSKMSKQKKESVMERFSNHEIDILVSTSVIEVGVNVPNSTVIIIEGAERFGLAQLHQLRGRVTRSTHQAYCYLFADAKSDKTRERLKALTAAANGFELAELDLAQRGAGDIVGRKQWGVTDLGMEAIKNLKMVEAARTEAQKIIATDPELTDHQILAQTLADRPIAEHLE